MLNLYELASIIGEKIKVGVGTDGFKVEFLDCEIKDNKQSQIIGSCWGEGQTIDCAADNYFRKINGRWLVFDATGKRREYSAVICQDPAERVDVNRKR